MMLKGEEIFYQLGLVQRLRNTRVSRILKSNNIEDYSNKDATIKNYNNKELNSNTQRREIKRTKDLILRNDSECEDLREGLTRERGNLVR